MIAKLYTRGSGDEQDWEKCLTAGKAVEWYLGRDGYKLPALRYLLDYIKDSGFTNILSLGSGTCVLEHLLQQTLGSRARVVATDINPRFIKHAKSLFPDLAVLEFDMIEGNIDNLEAATGVKFDAAVFFGSSYVMDDKAFVKRFSSLREAGVRGIIDFQAGCITAAQVITLLGLSMLRSTQQGRFHGYARTWGHLLRQYRKAGLRLVASSGVSAYRTAVLHA